MCGFQMENEPQEQENVPSFIVEMGTYCQRASARIAAGLKVASECTMSHDFFVGYDSFFRSAWRSHRTHPSHPYISTTDSCCCCCCCCFLLLLMSSTTPYPSLQPSPHHHAPPAADTEQRNFTAPQLRKFDGTDGQPVYLAVQGLVFQVDPSFYGPDGPFGALAGRECAVVLAKMKLDAPAPYLDLLPCGDDDDDVAKVRLSDQEQQELDHWMYKFTHVHRYTVVGRCCVPVDPTWQEVIYTADMLAAYDGSSATALPEGYATAPIYLGAGHQVFDVSFGGTVFYGPGGGYHRFAGKDASRALAKMSFADEDLESGHTADLNEKQIKTLNDWITTFRHKKQYPVVGKLLKK